MKHVHFLSALGQHVASGDVNACCGALRRIFSETLQAERLSSMQVVLTKAATANSSDSASRLVSSCSSAIPSNNSVGAFGRSGLACQLKPLANSIPLSQEVLELGRACLKDNASLVLPSSVDVLCYTAQRIGEWEKALYFASHLSDPPSSIFLASLLRPGNAKVVSSRCEREGWAIDIVSAIRVLAQEHGDWSAALAVARDAEQRFPLGERYSLAVLVPYLTVSGAQVQAMELISDGIAQGSLVEPRLIEQLIRQMTALCQWESCLHVLRLLSKSQETAQLLPSCPNFFQSIMEISPHWRTSLEVFYLARASDVKPDTRTLSILLSQCDEAGAWETAAHLYDVARCEGFVGSLANDRTYRTLVRSFSAVRQWEKALEALSWMSKANEASVMAGMAELVEVCEQSGQWEAALTVGSSLLDAGPELLTQQTILALLFACAKGAQWCAALQVFAHIMCDVRVQPHPLAVCAVLQSCMAANRWKEAVQALTEVRAQRPRLVVPPLAYRLGIKTCTQSHQWAEAMLLLEVMRKDGLPQDNHSQHLGMWAAALAGHWELSLAYLQTIPLRSRSMQDRMVIRSATRYISPMANAIALRYLQSQ